MDAIATMKADNPGWEHRLYSLPAMREWILANCGRAMLDRFDSIAPGYGAAKADLFRYLAMERDGGLYLDVKITVDRPLDELVQSGRYLLTQWDNGAGEPHEGWGFHPELRAIVGGEYIQGCIAAPPASHIIRAVIDEVCARLDAYDPATRGVGRNAVLSTTGPIAYSLAVERTRHDAPHQIIKPLTKLGLGIPATWHSGGRRQYFAGDYVFNWRPLVVRPGWRGLVERERARMVHLLTQAKRVKNIPARVRRTISNRPG